MPDLLLDRLASIRAAATYDPDAVYGQFVEWVTGRGLTPYTANPNAGIALRTRQIVDQHSDQLRDVYAHLAAGRTDLAPAKRRRTMALLEGLDTGGNTTRTLTQLTALLSTGRRKGKGKSSRQLEDVKLLLLRAHANSHTRGGATHISLLPFAK